MAGDSALASVWPSHLSCLPWDWATWDGGRDTVSKSPRAAQAWAFRGIQAVTCWVGGQAWQGEEGERAALRVPYRTDVLWAGSLVTHGFWESAGYTRDLVCPQGPTSGCSDDLGQGLGPELGRMRGS